MLHFEGLQIMLDCANAPGLTMPNLKDIDWEHVGVILLSSYYSSCLPYITEFTKFSGRIFATLPTIEFTRLLLTEELQDVAQWNVDHLQPIQFPFAQSDVESCIHKIEAIYFNETKVTLSHTDDS
jgi:integrator complex subunit 9